MDIVVFNPNAAPAKPITDVWVEFADGQRVIPGMDGPASRRSRTTSPQSLAQWKAVTFEEFNRAFHQKAAGETLRGVQKQLLADHFRSITRF